MNEPEDGNTEALMDELRKRVEMKKAAGLYALDGLSLPQPSTEPFRADELTSLARAAVLSPDLNLAQSTRGGVGKVVTKTKVSLARATSQPLTHVADQATAFNLALLAYVTELAQEVAYLRERLDEIDGERPDQ
jgi:hypothetical protein